MAGILLVFQNIVIEFCIPVSFNVIKEICSILNYYFIRSIYYLYFIRSQIFYFLYFYAVFCALCTVCVFHIPFYTKYCYNFFLGMIKLSFYLPKNLQKYSIKIYSIKESLFDFKCFPLLLKSKNLMKLENETRVTLE